MIQKLPGDEIGYEINVKRKSMKRERDRVERKSQLETSVVACQRVEKEKFRGWGFRKTNISMSLRGSFGFVLIQKGKQTEATLVNYDPNCNDQKIAQSATQKNKQVTFIWVTKLNCSFNRITELNKYTITSFHRQLPFTNFQVNFGSFARPTLLSNLI